MHKTIAYLTSLVAIIAFASPLKADLVGYWKLDEGTGTAVLDQIPPYDDGTIAPPNPAAVAWSTDGYKGGCLEFLTATGPFTMVDVPLVTPLDVQEASYAFWMKMPKTFQAWGIIFVLLGANIDHSIEPDGAADLYVSSGSIWFGTKDARLNDNQWHHVAVTYSSSAGQICIYIDGRLAASNASTVTDPILTVRIGGPRNRVQWRRFIGKLDEVAVWNHPLDQAQVNNVLWFGPQWGRYATNPYPANQQTLDTPQVTLSWTAGETAAMHRLYVSEVMEQVRDGLPSADQGILTSTSFANYPWKLGTTYYWRVDEIEADGKTIWPGAVWSFTISAKPASDPFPADGQILVDTALTLSWRPGAGAISHDVYFGTDPTALALVSKGQTANTLSRANLQYETRYYWRVDEFDGTTTYQGQVWSFATTPLIQVTDPNLVGYWNLDSIEAGIAIDWSGRARHGTVLGGPSIAEGYNNAAVAFDGIDDAIEVPQAVFTNLTLMAWIKADTPAPEGTTARAGSGLLWSDHAGGGDHFNMAIVGKKLAFETGPGGNPNTISSQDVVTGDWVHVAVTRSEDTRQVELYINGGLDNTGNHTGDRNIGANPKIVIGANPLDGRYFKGVIDEVRAYDKVLSADQVLEAMRTNRKLAWRPAPANGAVLDIRQPLTLGWTAGEGAVGHDLYLGTDLDAVKAATNQTPGLYKGRLQATSYSLPEPLQWATTYYWRIDEVQSDGSAVRGQVWSFRVADYLIVDDFESYDDLCNRIFFYWLDGFGHSGSTECNVQPSSGNGTGSTVGNFTQPFAERQIVYAGLQSMPFGFENGNSPYYSETTRRWDQPQDWTVGPVDTLRLAVRGDAAAFLQTGTNSYMMNGIGADIWGTSDQFRFAYMILNGNGSITARIDSLTNTHSNAKAGVMIREVLAPESIHAMVDVTPGAGVEFITRTITLGESTSAILSEATAPYWVRLTRTGNTLVAQCSADGINWTAVGSDPAQSQVTLTISSQVYIGLVVTSHNTNQACVARFSNVSFTGSVTGPWQTADIGLTQIPGNTPESLYVLVEDASGRTCLVSHPDPGVIATGNWELWDIPLAQFSAAGLDMRRIKAFTIGIGNRNNPSPGGRGKVYIDQITLVKTGL
ncbi:MAG: LamG domain-containing protein [Sedimentisphaerales bacterium]|jgi:regulation of enolase protein 1 (concanavalin A-like superfamily)|nr:LamG domain-containing protein [Sedimentisphaerales bacterium]